MGCPEVQGGLEKKDVDERGVNWKLLGVGIGYLLGFCERDAPVLWLSVATRRRFPNGG
jgi:hypothetical protein